MRVLVIGNGAREHALACRLRADPDRPEIVAAPGNPGLASVGRILPCEIGDAQSLLALADREGIDFTVVGPELPLSRGVVDAFLADGRPILGPTASAARLESSKAFAKAFMARHGVPTARFRTCTSVDSALHTVRSDELGWPVVLKADGLAAGKGVVIAENLASAEASIHDAMASRKFGAAGETLVVEECLTGPEISFFVLADGNRGVEIGTAQDHKRIFDGDAGPNTGGMGAFAPSPLVDAPLRARIMEEIIDPVIAGMRSDGHPFRGFLYAGLMLTASGPKVIEFNVRLGDPEAQVILPLVDEPLLPLLRAAARGELPDRTARTGREAAVGVVLASRGYPESSEPGREISGVSAAEAMPNVSVYHAGTAQQDGRLLTAGGRVLTVVGQGPDFPSAIRTAYAGVSAISFDGMQYRRDIGQKALLAGRR